MSINALIKRLKATPSRNDKIAILESVKGTAIEEQFKDICVMTYSPTIDYFIAKCPVDGPLLTSKTLDDGLQLLDLLSTGLHRGNKGREMLGDCVGRMNEDDQYIMTLIVARDLKCGMSEGTINKVWPELIYVHPYMRCSSFSRKNLAKISFPCYSQVKMDGLYIDVIPDHLNEMMYTMTRNGNVIDVLNDDDAKHIYQHTSGQYVLQGEVLVLDESMQFYLSRSEGNGIINSDHDLHHRVKVVCWDAVLEDDFYVGKSTKPYKERLETLVNISDNILEKHDVIRTIDTRVCNKVDDIIDHFKTERLRNNEGTVIKGYDGVWKDGTSPQQIKVKVIFDCDLKIIGYKEGTGKNEGSLGSLLCSSSCGKLVTYIGIGFKDKDRRDLWKIRDQLVRDGAIIAAKANDIVDSESRKEDVRALFLPRFIEVRKDKTEADDLARIEEQLAAFTDALKLIK